MAASSFTAPAVLRKALHSFLPLRLTHMLISSNAFRSLPLSNRQNSSLINHVSQGNTHLVHVNFEVSIIKFVVKRCFICEIPNTRFSESSEASSLCNPWCIFVKFLNFCGALSAEF